MTLIEVVIAITLMALLVTGMTLAMRMSLTSLAKANDKLTFNRRVTGAQRILEQQNRRPDAGSGRYSNRWSRPVGFAGCIFPGGEPDHALCLHLFPP